MEKRKIILAPPYSGALYAYFHDCLNNGNGSHKDWMGHHYYKNLYGMYTEQTKDMALTLCTIYDEVIIAAADAFYPREKNIGVYMDEGIWENNRSQNEKEIEPYKNDPVLANILSGFDEWNSFELLRELLFCAKRSIEFNCPVFCGEGSKKILDRINQILYNNKLIQSESERDFIQQYMTISGLMFNITDLDIFQNVKNNATIRDYCNKFVKTLENVSDQITTESALKKLIIEAIHTDETCKYIKGIFNVSSVGFSLGGFIPIVGTASSAMSLAMTAGEKALSKVAPNWYELSAQIQSVSNLELLRKNII